ncbi:hypothetical protein TWF281_011817 [Arthrobotrys megalospora]
MSIATENAQVVCMCGTNGFGCICGPNCLCSGHGCSSGSLKNNANYLFFIEHLKIKYDISEEEAIRLAYNLVNKYHHDASGEPINMMGSGPSRPPSPPRPPTPGPKGPRANCCGRRTPDDGSPASS